MRNTKLVVISFLLVFMLMVGCSGDETELISDLGGQISPYLVVQDSEGRDLLFVTSDSDSFGPLVTHEGELVKKTDGHYYEYVDGKWEKLIREAECNED